MLSRIDAENQCSSIAPLMNIYSSAGFGSGLGLPHLGHLYKTSKFTIPQSLQIQAISYFPPDERAENTDVKLIYYYFVSNVSFLLNIIQYYQFGGFYDQ